MTTSPVSSSTSSSSRLTSSLGKHKTEEEASEDKEPASRVARSALKKQRLNLEQTKPSSKIHAEINAPISTTTAKYTSSTSSSTSSTGKRKAEEAPTSKIVRSILKKQGLTSEKTDHSAPRNVQINKKISTITIDKLIQTETMSSLSESSQESPSSQVDLSVEDQMALRGRDLEIKAKNNPRKAKELRAAAVAQYNLSINQKSALGEAYLGYYLIRHKTDQSDSKRGLALIISSASKKNRWGLFYLGFFHYKKVKEVHPDSRIAYICFCLSAQKKLQEALDYKKQCENNYQVSNETVPDSRLFNIYFGYYLTNQSDKEIQERGRETLESELMNKLSDDAFALCANYLGQYLVRVQSSEDCRKGLELLISSAKKGNSEAQYHLGSCYFEGIPEILNPNLEIAYVYFSKCAEKHPLAATYIGKCQDQLEEHGVVPDESEFEDILAKAEII